MSWQKEQTKPVASPYLTCGTPTERQSRPRAPSTALGSPEAQGRLSQWVPGSEAGCCQAALCISWLHWKLIKLLAQTLPSSRHRSSHFRKHQTALKCDIGVCQFLHRECCFLQRDYLCWPSGTVWASRSPTPGSKVWVVDGVEEGRARGRRGGGELTGAATSLRSICGVAGRGRVLGTFLSQAAGTAVNDSSCRAQNGSEHGLSLPRPGRQPPVPRPHCCLWLAAQGTQPCPCSEV